MAARRNRRRHRRYLTDRFVPSVLHGADRPPLGGHVVDVSRGGARMVAAPNLAELPDVGEHMELVLARSDGNRELDIDGARVPVVVVDLREPPGARVIRVAFDGDPPRRITAWIARLAQQSEVAHDDGLPEFDPDVWAGWAAISPEPPTAG